MRFPGSRWRDSSTAMSGETQVYELVKELREIYE